VSIGLRRRVRDIVMAHGGLRAASRETGIYYWDLWRLAKGWEDWPDTKVLRRLGLRRVVTYELLPSVRGGLTTCDMKD
jgi:hypothetical protein